MVEAWVRAMAAAMGRSGFPSLMEGEPGSHPGEGWSLLWWN